MLDIKIPDITTKLACDIDIPAGEYRESIEGKIIDLSDSLGQKIKAWKKLSQKRVVCLGKQLGKEVQYTFEIENIKGNNSIASALNAWMYAKGESKNEKYKGKEIKYYEKVYFNSPRLYEVQINRDVFRLNLRMAKLTEMGRNLLLEKKKSIRRKGRIHTILRENGYIDKLEEFHFERTLESNGEVVEKFVEEMVKMCILTELEPPKPVEPPFYFRIGEIKKIGDHFLKLTKQRGREEDNLLSIDSLNDFLDDDFDEIVTRQEMREIQAKMKRKIRKIAREYWKKKNSK